MRRRIVSSAIGALVLSVFAGQAAAGEIEAYPISATEEIGAGAKAPAIPAPGDKTLALIAPRNAVANGQILLRTKGGSAVASVAVSDLKGPGGASIPASAVQVRYGQYINSEPVQVTGGRYESGDKELSVYRWQKGIGMSAKADEANPASYNIAQGYWRIDCLMATPQCDLEENLPRCAWLTFSIARDTAPGVYKGAATVKGAGGPVPIELEVVDAIVPNLADSAMSNDIRPMWEVIALGNGIPLEECWKSDKFWKVTSAYLEKLGQLRVGNCGVAVMAPSTTSCLGMVQWIKKGGQWSWNYAAMDKFIESYRKAIGEPKVLEATAFVQDEQKPGLAFLYTDGGNGQQALQTMADDPAAADLAAAFVKDLRSHLATLKLDKKLVVGVWHDKMAHTGGKIRERLLQEFPDLKVSLWAHSDGWGMPLKDRVAFYMSKCHVDGGSRPYPIKSGIRTAREKSVAFGPQFWDAIARNYVGLGQIDFSNWSSIRRPKEYTYYGAGMFVSYQRQLVYPMLNGQVTTGVLYELFREYGQDYELLNRMRAQGVKTGFLADPRAALDPFTQIDKAGGRLSVKGNPIKEVELMHREIVRQAGQAKVRPEGK